MVKGNQEASNNVSKAMEMLKAISLKEEWEIVTKTCSIL